MENIKNTFGWGKEYNQSAFSLHEKQYTICSTPIQALLLFFYGEKRLKNNLFFLKKKYLSNSLLTINPPPQPLKGRMMIVFNDYM